MAIDTQAKRGAALGFSGIMPSLALPFPDGTIDADDRFVLLGLYPFAAETGEGGVAGSMSLLGVGR